MRRNWSDTVDLAGSEARPASAAEVAALVRRDSSVLALGSAHSFSAVAVTPGLHIDTTGLPADISVEGTTAAVGAGTTYAVLGRELHARGVALAAMALLYRAILPLIPEEERGHIAWFALGGALAAQAAASAPGRRRSMRSGCATACAPCRRRFRLRNSLDTAEFASTSHSSSTARSVGAKSASVSPCSRIGAPAGRACSPSTASPASTRTAWSSATRTASSGGGRFAHSPRDAI